MKPESDNQKYQYAVAVVKESIVVGHFPKNFSYPVFFISLQREGNVFFCEVTGERAN